MTLAMVAAESGMVPIIRAVLGRIMLAQACACCYIRPEKYPRVIPVVILRPCLFSHPGLYLAVLYREFI